MIYVMTHLTELQNKTCLIEPFRKQQPQLLALKD